MRAFPLAVAAWLVTSSPAQSVTERAAEMSGANVTSNSAESAEKARSLYLKARHTEDEDARAELFGAAHAAAETARAANARDPKALLWWVATKGEVALLRGKLRALGDIPSLESTLKELLAVDPGYEKAAADRGLARLYQLVPPIISIGSKRKAAQHYEAAFRRAPDFMGNLALYADFLADRGEQARARELAKAALAADRSGIDALDVTEWEKMARDVLGSGAG